jgi:hypothetical protein
MNVRETYNAIARGSREDTRHALFELLAQVQTLATATLEIAGQEKLNTGRDPLSMHSRNVLAEFIGLPRDDS